MWISHYTKHNSWFDAHYLCSMHLGWDIEKIQFGLHGMAQFPLMLRMLLMSIQALNQKYQSYQFTVIWHMQVLSNGLFSKYYKQLYYTDALLCSDETNVWYLVSLSCFTWSFKVDYHSPMLNRHSLIPFSS